MVVAVVELKHSRGWRCRSCSISISRMQMLLALRALTDPPGAPRRRRATPSSVSWSSRIWVRYDGEGPPPLNFLQQLVHYGLSVWPEPACAGGLLPSVPHSTRHSIANRAWHGCCPATARSHSRKAHSRGCEWNGAPGHNRNAGAALMRSPRRAYWEQERPGTLHAGTPNGGRGASSSPREAAVSSNITA